MLWRGAAGLFPGMFFYFAFACLTQVMFASKAYEAQLFIQVLMTPLKLWVAWEAVSMRLFFVQHGTPPRVRGERYWLGVFGVGMAIMLVSATLAAPVQYNVPQFLVKARTLTQVAITSILFVAWLYCAVRDPKSPRRTKGHLALLLVWFVISLSNLIPIGRGQRWLWDVVSISAMVARLACMSGWLWLFRPTRMVSFGAVPIECSPDVRGSRGVVLTASAGMFPASPGLAPVAHEEIAPLAAAPIPCQETWTGQSGLALLGSQD